MNITHLRFDKENIYGTDTLGIEHAQPLFYYPRLKRASADERNTYVRSTIGFHWTNLDEDISFESFFYDFDNDEFVLHEDETPYKT